MQIERKMKQQREAHPGWASEIAQLPGCEKLFSCIQCGTCSGTCPVSYAMDITPRQIVALFRGGQLETILRSRAIWLCASCYSCTVRCPNGIKVTDTLYALKRIAMSTKIYPLKFPVHTLSREFTKNIYNYGRNYELGLGLRYFLSTNIVKLFSNFQFGLTMIRRKRLGLLPRRLKRIGQIRAIIKKANEFGEG